MAKHIAYIGTYSKGENGGIFRVSIDDETAQMTIVDTLDVENPSHLALTPDAARLYAASETGSFKGGIGGSVAAITVNAQGKLELMNMVGTKGRSPCFVTTSPDGAFVYAANYTEGTATVYATDENGALKEQPMVVVHQGTGPNERRQERPHVHCTKVTPDGKYLAICDLGIDTVVMYPLCDTCGLDTARGSFVRTPGGDGPRHIEFSKDGKFAYVVTEMACTVRAYAYEDGRMTYLSSANTLPDGFEGNNTCAAIHFSPDGRFLTCSNRGHDSLAVFEVNGGDMRLVQLAPVCGETPREFAYTPNGKYVFICNQDSGDITVLKVDAKTGEMQPTDIRYEFPRPVALLWKP